jgi:hypothetical protein
MTCQTLQDAIVEIARDGDVGERVRAAVDAHIDGCPSCRARLAREQQLTEGLRALARSIDEPPSDWFDSINARLQADFAAQHSQAPQHSQVKPGASRSRWIQVAAAVALAAGAFVAWRVAVAPPAQPRPEISAAMSEPIAPPILPVAGAAATSDRSPASPQGPSVRRPNNGTSPKQTPRFIRAEGFVQLPSAVGLPDFESGQIVRMELPLAMLPSYGIQIVPDARGSEVQADLLVGQDGQPRAIRLVGTSQESGSR